jgi:hypothetical protein
MKYFYLFSLFLLLGLCATLVAACGEEIPPTQAAIVPIAPTRSNIPTGGPVRVTFTAVVAPANGTETPPPTRTPVVQPRPQVTPGVNITELPTIAPATPFIAPPVEPSPVPLYTGLRGLDLQDFGRSLTEFLITNSPNARTNFYYTSDSFNQLAEFYNGRMDALGFRKAAQQALPTQLGLRGNVLIYSRGSGAALEVITMMVLGPLDANLVGAFGEGASGAKILRTGDSVVIVISGLTATDLEALEKVLKASGS